jgi:hypothetical protein
MQNQQAAQESLLSLAQASLFAVAQVGFILFLLGRVCKPYPGYAGRHKKGRFHVETPNRVFLYGTGSASSPASMPKSEHGVIVRCALRYGLQDVPVLDDLAVL